MKTVKLFITPSAEHHGYYNVVINGEGFYDSNNKRVGARVKGEDEWFDDNLFSIGTGLERVQHDGRFNLSKLVSGSQLDEDWGKDEVYALVDVEGGGTFRTNTVSGYY
jgi:hypothetical protein